MARKLAAGCGPTHQTWSPTRDYETRPTTSEAMIHWAAIAGMLARLARGGPATRQQRRIFNTPD
ncbi:hypothetical protein [Micromonospora sp. WMMD1082]|uniref:hypothetical protein n=1 Tax=Micromonospora sp. WMMD1082 TaxID=3016104 RepID=UPI002417530E|nr:hypothetical protein [Micromonospora sp. WMMD1082]MDG4795077.1 hypothetical protein [Micromonospora sp. WMMD1082]